MLYVILPAYNESRDIAELLNHFVSAKWNFLYKIIVVDDGSVDDTSASVNNFNKKLPVKIIKHPVNEGLGRTLLTAFNYVQNNLSNDDVIITMDSDNTHPVDLIPEMKIQIDKGSDIVVASRFIAGGEQIGVPFFRMILSSSASFLLKMIYPVKNVTDYTSGYRAFSAKLIKKMYAEAQNGFIDEISFSATLEIILKSSKFTTSISELPLVLYYNRKTGKSKMKIFQTLLSYISLLLKARKF